MKIYDDASATVDHSGHEVTVEAHGSKQIEVDLIEPKLIGERGKASAWRGRAAEIVHENVQTTQILDDSVGDVGRSICGSKIGWHEMGRQVRRRRRACDGGDPGSGRGETANHSFASTLRSARDEHAPSRELGGVVMEKVGVSLFIE